VNIRTAALEDAPAIAQLLCNLEDYPNFKARGVEALTAQVISSLKLQHDQQLVFVAELEGEI
jgi:N-acetylglutamate synthase-like GNAT family acetyltransferase